MKKIFNIILYVVVAVTISGCVMLKVYPTEKDKKSESSLLKAVDPTAIPTGETWETVRGVIDDNFDNVNGTLDSIEITLSEYSDSITNYSTNKLNVSDTASMLEPYALTSELADAGTSIGDVRDEIADSLNVLRPTIGSGDVIGSDTITPYTLAVFSGVDAITGYPSLFTSTAGESTTLYIDRGRFGSSGDSTDTWGGRHANSMRLYNKPSKIDYPNIVLYGSYIGTGFIGIKDSIVAISLGQYSPSLKFTVESTFNKSLVPLFTTASTTSLAGLRIPHGIAPSFPVNGDLWTTTGGIFTQINGSTDTLATQEYARQYGGTGTVTISDVQNEIADSLDVLRPLYVAVADTSSMLSPYALTSELGGAGLTEEDVSGIVHDSITDLLSGGVELSDVAVMIADSTGNAIGNYVTRKALVDSIAAAGTGTGVSITDVRNEIADSLNAIRSASVQGVALSDSTDLYVTITRLRDSLLVVRDSINVLRSEIDDLWLAFANLGTGDVTAPYVESAELGTYNDSIVVVLLSASDVQQDSVPPTSAFTLYEDAVEMGIAEININYDTLFISLDSIGVYGAGYTLDYTRTYPMLQDSTGNRTQSFTARTVTNNVAEVGGGPENMVSNGTFSSTDDWTFGYAGSSQGLSITGGHLAFTDTPAGVDDSYVDQTQAEMVTGLQSGVNYTLEFDITMVGTGLSVVRFYTNGGGTGITPYGTERGTGHYSINFTAPTITTGGLHIGAFYNASQGWYLDNIVIYPQE